jgi:hypothetical protein
MQQSGHIPLEENKYCRQRSNMNGDIKSQTLIFPTK